MAKVASYPVISFRQPQKKPKRKPVGFHIDEGSFLLSLLLVLGALGAMTTFAESYHVTVGKYDHLKPKPVRIEEPPKPTKVLPEKFKGGADRYDDIFTAYAANPEAFAVHRKGKSR